MYLIWIFILGTIFGSFANVLVDRGFRGKSLLGRSKCDFCHYTLHWYDNIPIISFLVIGGRCRKCQRKLSWQYPLVELGMGLLFLLFAWQILPGGEINDFQMAGTGTNKTDQVQFIPAQSAGSVDDITLRYSEEDRPNTIIGTENYAASWQSADVNLNQSHFSTDFRQQQFSLWLPLINVIFWLAVAFLFTVIFLWDCKYMLIPDELVISGLLITAPYLAWRFFQNSSCSIFDWSCSPISNLVAGLVVSGFFYAMFHFSRGRWIGGGDVKLGFWLGLLVGLKNVYFFLMGAYLLGALVAILLLLKKRKNLNSQLAFGPFLLVSAGLIILWEGVWWGWWAGLLVG